VFYFRPGHETYPIYHDPRVLLVLTNAARYLAPASQPVLDDTSPHVPADWFRQGSA
jgi:trehalose utilization protein